MQDMYEINDITTNRDFRERLAKTIYDVFEKAHNEDKNIHLNETYEELLLRINNEDQINLYERAHKIADEYVKKGELLQEIENKYNKVLLPGYRRNVQFALKLAPAFATEIEKFEIEEYNKAILEKYSDPAKLQQTIKESLKTVFDFDKKLLFPTTLEEKISTMEQYQYDIETLFVIDSVIANNGYKLEPELQQSLSFFQSLFQNSQTNVKGDVMLASSPFSLVFPKTDALSTFAVMPQLVEELKEFFKDNPSPDFTVTNGGIEELNTYTQSLSGEVMNDMNFYMYEKEFVTNNEELNGLFIGMDVNGVGATLEQKLKSNFDKGVKTVINNPEMKDEAYANKYLNNPGKRVAVIDAQNLRKQAFVEYTKFVKARTAGTKTFYGEAYRFKNMQVKDMDESCLLALYKIGHNRENKRGFFSWIFHPIKSTRDKIAFNRVKESLGRIDEKFRNGDFEVADKILDKNFDLNRVLQFSKNAFSELTENQYQSQLEYYNEAQHQIVRENLDLGFEVDGNDDMKNIIDNINLEVRREKVMVAHA